MTQLDPAIADNVHYATDPRIRHLAEAAWRMRTEGTRMDWLCLGKDNPEALITEAREWVRAAVASGLLPAPSSEPGWKSAAWAAANADDSADVAVSDHATITDETARHVLFHYGADGGHRPGRFTQLLMETIDAADVVHKARLRAAYPELVDAMNLAANDPSGTAQLQKAIGHTPTT